MAVKLLCIIAWSIWRFSFGEPYGDFLLFFQKEYILRKYSHGKGDLFFYVEPRVRF